MSSIILEQVSILARIHDSYANFEAEEPNMCLGSCKTRKANLERLWVKFEDNHYALFNHKDFQSLEEQPCIKDNLFSKTETDYLNSMGKFQSFIDSHSTRVVSNTDQASRNNSNRLGFFQNDTERLPKINLTKFNGDFNRWESFRDLFMSMVVNKANMSNVTKLHHLKILS